MSTKKEAVGSAEDVTGVDALDLVTSGQLVAAVKALTSEISSFNGKVTGIEENYKSQKRWLNWLIVSLILHVPVTIAFAILAIISLNTSSTADHASSTAKVALIQSCKSSNDFRTADLNRWHGIETFILSVDPTDVKTQQFVAAIDKQNTAADRLRNCSNLNVSN